MPIDIDMITHRIDLLRLEAHEREVVLAELNRLGLELERVLRDQTQLTAFSKARLNALLNQAADSIDQFYTKIERSLDSSLTATATTQAAAATQAMDAVLAGVETSLPAESVLRKLVQEVIIFGAPSKDWWAKQSDELAFRFAQAVRTGMMSGETNEQIVRKIVGTQVEPGILSVSRRDARALVHASIQTVANRAALDTFRKNADVVSGVKHISTLDSHTTPICIAYGTDGADDHGGEWDLEGAPLPGTTLPFNGGPPRHWGCRSVLVPITKTFRELGLPIDEFPPGMRASSSGPTKLSMEQWLRSRTKEQQDEQLGAGRAELWRQGKINLQQLLDLRGRPLTFAQLETRYGK